MTRGWTLDTLHDFLVQRLNDQDRLFSRRMDDADKAIGAALASAEKAVTKAEVTAEKRFEGINEFRGVLEDQQKTLLTRAEYNAAHVTLVDKINLLSERVAALDLRVSSGEGRDTGSEEQRSLSSRAANTRLLLLGVVISVIVIMVNVLFFVLSH